MLSNFIKKCSKSPVSVLYVVETSMLENLESS
jgi:hypothetical protein